MELIDSHAHIQSDLFGDEIVDVVQRSKDAGVIAVVNIGTSLRESQEAIDLARQFPNYLYPTVGLHPEDAAEEIKKHTGNELRDLFLKLAQKPAVVGIGECGLDYGKDPIADPPSFSTRQMQREIFGLQVEVARSLKLPLVVHCRNAWDDVFAMLDEYQLTTPVILHSFTGNEAVVQRALRYGNIHLSFSGIVTFHNAQDIQKAATFVPLDKLLVETDSPFLSPVPLRGQRNEPKNVVKTIEFLSILLPQNMENLASITVQNAKNVFQYCCNYSDLLTRC